MKKLAAIALLLTAAPLHAAIIASLTWDHSAEREDGTPLPLDELSHYVVRWDCRKESGETIVQIPQASAEIPIENHGKCTFTVTAVDIFEMVSAPSQPATLIYRPDSGPKPPVWKSVEGI